MTNLKVHTTKRTVEVGETSVGDLKLREFERADRDIRNFIAENDSLMQTFFDLIDTYNTAALDLKDEVRNAPGDNPVAIGKFKRGNRPQYVKYNAKTIDEQTLHTLAYHDALKVDTKTLEKLVVSGSIPADRVEKAKTVEPGSFRVTGPKAIEFNL